MKLHTVTVFPSKANLSKADQLAWKIAQVASDNAKIDSDVSEMVINRVIDNASVAIAAANRTPVANAAILSCWRIPAKMERRFLDCHPISDSNVNGPLMGERNGGA